MDGTFIEKTKFDLMTFSHAEFRMMYHIDLNAYAARGENWMSPSGILLVLFLVLVSGRWDDHELESGLGRGLNNNLESGLIRWVDKIHRSMG